MNRIVWELSGFLTYLIHQILSRATFGYLVTLGDSQRTSTCKVLKKLWNRFKNYGTLSLWGCSNDIWNMARSLALDHSALGRIFYSMIHLHLHFGSGTHRENLGVLFITFWPSSPRLSHNWSQRHGKHSLLRASGGKSAETWEVVNPIWEVSIESKMGRDSKRE
jgi:hypothetical protein